MLQIVQRASVSDGGDQCAQLQRRHGDAFAERTHLTDTPEPGVNFVRRKYAEMFALNVVASQLAQPKLAGGLGYFGENQPAAHRVQISIFWLCQKLGGGHFRSAPPAAPRGPQHKVITKS